MPELEKLTSKQWMEEEKYSHVKIMDPDGWDRKNYNYSFNEELITELEFNRRKCMSTCMINNVDKAIFSGNDLGRAFDAGAEAQIEITDIIDHKALLEDTITILVEHHGLEEKVVRRAIGNDPSFIETIITEMYSAQESYISHKYESLLGEINEGFNN